MKKKLLLLLFLISASVSLADLPSIDSRVLQKKVFLNNMIDIKNYALERCYYLYDYCANFCVYIYKTVNEKSRPLAGLKDYYYGKYILSNPLIYEHNVEKNHSLYHLLLDREFLLHLMANLLGDKNIKEIEISNLQAQAQITRRALKNCEETSLSFSQNTNMDSSTKLEREVRILDQDTYKKFDDITIKGLLRREEYSLFSKLLAEQNADNNKKTHENTSSIENSHILILAGA